MSSSDPQPSLPNNSQDRLRTGLIMGIVGGIIGGGLIIAVIVLFGDRVGMQSLVSTREVSDLTPQTPSAPLLEQTEAIFLKHLDDKPGSTDEWWAARSDHRLVAYAVLHCKKLPNLTIDTLPRRTFSTLLLDLTPSGNHVIETKRGDDVFSATRDRDAQPISLTSVDHDILALSDSIARARLFAAEAASSNVPWVHRLSLATLIVTALS
jgi:hypothetical protein